MGELGDLANRLPGWVLVVLAASALVARLGQVLASASDSWAKLLGPLGRRWRAQAERRTGRGDAVTADMQREIDRLTGRVDALVKRDQERDAEDRDRDLREHDRDRYLVYLIRRLKDIEMWAAEHLLDLPPPPVLSFDEWQAGRES